MELQAQRPWGRHTVSDAGCRPRVVRGSVPLRAWRAEEPQPEGCCNAPAAPSARVVRPPARSVEDIRRLGPYGGEAPSERVVPPGKVTRGWGLPDPEDCNPDSGPCDSTLVFGAGGAKTLAPSTFAPATLLRRFLKEHGARLGLRDDPRGFALRADRWGVGDIRQLRWERPASVRGDEAVTLDVQIGQGLRPLGAARSRALKVEAHVRRRAEPCAPNEAAALERFDVWAGVNGSPAALLARLDEVAARVGQGPPARFEIVLHPGAYLLERALTIGAEHGPLTLRAAEPGTAVVRAGRIADLRLVGRDELEAELRAGAPDGGPAAPWPRGVLVFEAGLAPGAQAEQGHRLPSGTPSSFWLRQRGPAGNPAAEAERWKAVNYLDPRRERIPSAMHFASDAWAQRWAALRDRLLGPPRRHPTRAEATPLLRGLLSEWQAWRDHPERPGGPAADPELYRDSPWAGIPAVAIRGQEAGRTWVRIFLPADDPGDAWFDPGEGLLYAGSDELAAAGLLLDGATKVQVTGLVIQGGRPPVHLHNASECLLACNTILGGRGNGILVGRGTERCEVRGNHVTVNPPVTMSARNPHAHYQWSWAKNAQGHDYAGIMVRHAEADNVVRSNTVSEHFDGIKTLAEDNPNNPNNPDPRWSEYNRGLVVYDNTIQDVADSAVELMDAVPDQWWFGNRIIDMVAGYRFKIAEGVGPLYIAGNVVVQTEEGRQILGRGVRAPVGGRLWQSGLAEAHTRGVAFQFGINDVPIDSGLKVYVFHNTVSAVRLAALSFNGERASNVESVDERGHFGGVLFLNNLFSVVSWGNWRGVWALRRGRLPDEDRPLPPFDGEPERSPAFDHNLLYVERPEEEGWWPRGLPAGNPAATEILAQVRDRVRWGSCNAMLEFGQLLWPLDRPLHRGPLSGVAPRVAVLRGPLRFVRRAPLYLTSPFWFDPTLGLADRPEACVATRAREQCQPRPDRPGEVDCWAIELEGASPATRLEPALIGETGSAIPETYYRGGHIAYGAFQAAPPAAQVVQGQGEVAGIDSVPLRIPR